MDSIIKRVLTRVLKNWFLEGGFENVPRMPLGIPQNDIGKMRSGQNYRKRGGVHKSMGHEVPWKTGMLICDPVTSRPLIVLQTEAVLSPCNFATTHSIACTLSDSEFLFPFNFATHEMEDPFATPQNRRKVTKPSEKVTDPKVTKLLNKRHQSGQKRPSGEFLLPPRGCEVRSGKAPIRPEKARFSRKDFCPIFSQNLRLRPRLCLQFPNAVVLNAVGRRNTQISAKERKHKSTKERSSASA